MASKKTVSQLADVLFPEVSEQESFADGVLSIPPELRKLHTDTYDFTVETIVEKTIDGSIFVPKFQRRYVWSDAQASRLVESLIIQCPIPVIYLNQETNETLSVIDGNQRLTSLRRYINNEFPLKGLTAYPELEGSRFHELDPRFQRHIQNRTLRCIVILKDTHPQVKFDVFERLNSGATKLTPQELRHGLYFGDLMSLATKTVKESGFLSDLEIKNDKRMKAEELVLRFWALSEGFNAYKKPLASFINDYSDKNRKLSLKRKDSLLKSFCETLEMVRVCLGELAFKVFDKKLNVESSFNAAVYDALMVGFYQAGLSGGIQADRRAGQAILAELIVDDEKFRRSISVATSDENQVKYRIRAVTEAFGKP
ncbi:Protein of unknown function DUF262 [Pseudomonas flavescens]|uniref:GmrSD restriction endonucleases N-terminal domain-containing protein n=1 Tax=Phytopseudomonas flavescens TaxID=29435 RepID=A0A1G8MSV2_9GAMM|nr:DUF262 domain-containing protein [Pseudomonas flavescens]SDI70933.1 Protein of unknown function DUF262 [Pseudomonas flavescens]